MEREITWGKIVGLRRPSVLNARRKDTLQVCKDIKWLNAEGPPEEEYPGIPGEYTLF